MANLKYSDLYPLIGGVNPWTPLLITTAMWLDASDMSTLSLDGSQKVSEWRDLSGNNRHASQSTANQRPSVFSNGINGRNVIVFAGGSVNLACTPAWSNYWEWFFVYKHDVTDVLQVPIRDSATPASTGIIGYPNTSGSFYRARNVECLDISTTIANEFGASVNISGMISQTNNTAEARLNGVTRGSWAVTGAMGSTLYLGTNGASLSLGLIGSICELILLPAPSTVDIRTKIEGYLAHKWSTTERLPFNHPYKLSAPND